MTSELLEDWLGCAWERRPGALSEPQGKLAIDAFRVHLCDRITNMLKNKNDDLLIIPRAPREKSITTI
jgi:hypothetical protein